MRQCEALAASEESGTVLGVLDAPRDGLKRKVWWLSAGPDEDERPGHEAATQQDGTSRPRPPRGGTGGPLLVALGCDDNDAPQWA